MSAKKIFLDTDMGPDCDDAGALAVLHNLGAEIVGFTHCTSDIDGSVTIAAINAWFGKPHIPIGQYEKEGFLCEDKDRTYVHDVAKEYLKNHLAPRLYGAVELMRRVLTKERNVILVGIGPLSNIANLLMSGPDGVSDKSGAEILSQSVDRVVLMGGNFGTFEPEFNIRSDIPAARMVARRCPVPITFCGFETGVNVITGNSLYNSPDGYPVKKAYWKYNNQPSFERPSWDLVAAYYAVMGKGELWDVVSNVSVDFDESGGTILKKGGKDSYLVNRAGDREISARLEEMLYRK